MDVTDASGTLLFDAERRCWSDEVTQVLEVRRSWLPSVLESSEVSGRTADGVAVAAGAGDQAAAALGVGVDRPGPLSVVLGTSGVVFAALPAFAADPQHACTRSATRCPRLARDGGDAVGRGLGCSGSVTRWLEACRSLSWMPRPRVGRRAARA